MQDCPEGDDESGCGEDLLSCPYMFRCKNSTCLSQRHVCDGIVHCPLADDERTCHIACPDKCLCDGSVWICTTTLLPKIVMSPVFALHIRISDSLDHDSGPDIKFIPKTVIRLDLQSNGLSKIPDAISQLEDLTNLDLSKNAISVIGQNAFIHCSSLTDIIFFYNKQYGTIIEFVL